MSNNRIYNKKVDISYKNTVDFFEKRARKYDEANPYVVTMYQDNNPQIVVERDIVEKNKIMPKLNLKKETRVLDIGCGIGRWGEILLANDIAYYCGIDASEGLLEIAEKRLTDYSSKIRLSKMMANEIENKLEGEKFDLVIVAGLFAYLNDDDIGKVLSTITALSSETVQIYIREPISLQERLTLDQFYSEDLKDSYSVIYRDLSFFMEKFKEYFTSQGIAMKEHGFLFEDSLNNRKDTAQYYFVLERG